MNYEFSIITCTYNAAEVLQRTLDSVAAQSYPHIEHIIVDGASKDETMQMVRAYEEKIAARYSLNIKSERDKGLYDAMNKGIERATGDYLVFLNAGDIFASANTLSDIAEQLDKLPATEGGEGWKAFLPGVVYGNTLIVNNEGTVLGQRRLQPPEKLTWKSFKRGMLVCHQAFYARTDIAKETPYDLRYKLSADVDWCIRIMKLTEKKNLALHNMHQPLCHYLEGGLSIKNHRASLIERFKIMARHYGLLTTIAMHISFIFRK